MPRPLSPLQAEIPRLATLARNDTSWGARVVTFTVDLEDWIQGLTSTNSQPDRWASYKARVEANTDQLLALLTSSSGRVSGN